MTALSESSGTDLQPRIRRPSASLAVASLGVLLALVTFTVPLATMAGTAADLHAGPGAQAWILSGMSVGAAAGLLSSGALGGQMIAGLGGVAAGQLALVGIHPHVGLLRLLPGLLVVGAANGALNAALGRQAVASVPADRAAMGSGANNTARYLGSAIGITIISVILTRSSGGTEPADVVAGWNLAVIVTTVFSVLGAVVVLATRSRPHPHSDRTIPPNERTGP